MSLQFDMVNVDDLEEGFQPFSIGSRGTAASRNAANYDLLHQGNLGTTMADINNSRNSALALRQDRVLLHMLIKSNHPLPIEFDRFCIAWHQDEGALDELRETTLCFAALVLRWVQLRLANWFSEQSRLGGAKMDAPNLVKLPKTITLQEQWCPTIPAQYLPSIPRQPPTYVGPERELYNSRY
jgi:hypothetical protein